MELLTEEIRNHIPELASQEDLDDPVVYVKFCTPGSNRAWFATEGEPVLGGRGEELDFEFFGRVYGPDVSWGSWTLNELLSVKDSPGHVDVKRNPHFNPKAISEHHDAVNLF
jgi:hypothetical protein